MVRHSRVIPFPVLPKNLAFRADEMHIYFGGAVFQGDRRRPTCMCRGETGWAGMAPAGARWEDMGRRGADRLRDHFERRPQRNASFRR